MKATANQDFYLNFNQFTDMKRDARNHTDGAKEAAAQQFESLFIQQMLKEMRSAAVVDKEQHSRYMEFYTDMHDKQIALDLAKSGGIGIAKHLMTQLTLDEMNASHSPNMVGKFFPLQEKVAAAMPFSSEPKGMAFTPDNTQRSFSVDTTRRALGSDSLRNSLEHLLATKEVLDSGVVLQAIAEETSRQLSQGNEQAVSLASHFGSLDTLAIDEFHQVQTTVDNSVVQLSALRNIDTKAAPLLDEKIQPHQGWKNSNQFVQELMPHAQQVAQQLGVKAEVLVAQSALETGWGKYTMRHEDGRVAFSLFGIKADSRWSGETVAVTTHEFRHGRMQKQVAEFRAYDSVAEAMQDYANFISDNQRYQGALANSADASHYVNGLQKAGYATDPNYANKILNILHGDTLKDSLVSLNASAQSLRESTISNVYKEVA